MQQFASAGVAVARPRDNESIECARTWFDAVKEDALWRIVDLIERFDGLQEIYDNCLTLAEDEQSECLQNFSQYTLQYLSIVIPGALEGVSTLLIQLNAYLH